METEVLRKYEVRVENVSCGGNKPTIMLSVYSDNNEYVGRIEDFQKYLDRGILPETFGNNGVCSIGKSFKDGKWYGWSHRAMFGFEIGNKVKKGDCCAESGWVEGCEQYKNDPYVLPVGFEAKTEEDCKKMAMAFARSVG